MNLELILKMIFNIIGGLGIFLLGMKYMSDGLQTVSGPSLRKMIGAVTNNKFMAIGVGVVVTSVVQSSSVTTVMVVGFVNSGIMALEQALGVIIGANIGTTITGWILVLKIGKYGLPILGIAAFLFLFSNKEKVRYTALSIMGVGMIFFGLEIMKDGVSFIKEIPEFHALFNGIDGTTFSGVMWASLIGTVATVIVQSSSATLGITIALASKGVITFDAAAALVLGLNIGTTITAFLASLGTGSNAKRAAYFHVIFNILGTLWLIPIFFLYVEFAIGLGNWVTGILDIEYDIIAKIASVHTLFNICNTILFFPFIAKMSSMLVKMIPDKKKKELKDRKYLTHLDFHMFESSFAAVEQSKHEIDRMDDKVRLMFDNLKQTIENPDSSDDIANEIFEREDILDHVQKEITTFLTEILGENVPHDIAEEAQVQLRMADEYESVSDEITIVLKLYIKLRESDLSFTGKQSRELLKIHDDVVAFYSFIHSKLSKSHNRFMDVATEQSLSITENFREIREKHWVRLSKSKLDPMVGTTYMDIANSYRRSKDHLVNIAEAICGEKMV